MSFTGIPSIQKLLKPSYNLSGILLDPALGLLYIHGRVQTGHVLLTLKFTDQAEHFDD